MIIVDTSVWVDHLRRGDASLAALLDDGRVLSHPLVIGEIACGVLGNRTVTLELLRNLPTAILAEHYEVISFIEQHRLYGRGIGFIDVHLLASAALLPGTSLWTRDRQLQSAALALRLAHTPTGPH